MSFATAVRHVLTHEGGYVNDPNDPGGETKFGISKRSFPNLDIAALTEADAIAIYRVDYWQRLQCDELPPALAIIVFDTGVNMGRTRAVLLLQQALGVRSDGILGPVTLAAAAKAEVPAVLTNLCARRAVTYANLRTFENFGRNWMVRLFDTYRLALEQAA